MNPQRYRVLLLLTAVLLVSAVTPFLYANKQRSQPLREALYPSVSAEEITQAQIDVSAPVFHPPLRTQGRDIVDANGTRVKLASISWYGASDELFVPGGLEVQHRDAIAAVIRRMGFNSVRLPYSDEMVRSNPVVPDSLLAANRDLLGFSALGVFRAVVDSLTRAGLAVVVNNHITKARWCCDWAPCDLTWTNSVLGSMCRVSQTEDAWIDNWATVMRPHVDNPLVVGADLRNEPRGLFGAAGWALWATAAERAAERLLAMQPGWLIVVEGIASANDLSRARDRPISLSVPHRVVYSAHVYGWSGWGSLDTYWTRSYEDFAADMRKNWAFLLDPDTPPAPVWIGEIGAPERPNEGDANYWTNLVRFLKETDVGFAYWALNPRKPATDEREGYSLLEDDWVTTIYDYRLCDLQKLMLEKAFCS